MIHNKGFTLIEFMIAVAIAAILITVGLPAMRDMVMNNQLTSQINQLVTSFNLARMESIKRGSQVRISATDSDWNEGWSVWVDEDGNGAMADGEQIYVVEAMDGETSLTALGGQTEVIFTADGMTQNNVTDTFQMCDSRSGEEGKSLTLMVSGTVRYQALTCS